ncbi:unnamed protein product [Lymnaea stagnalis]|uniref:Tetratricopeptide repeat protein 27 n=1 Tax=Lymnaea stagnalis TaxID=6523 RepID=A0AAV2HMJ7_LYMST
MSASMKQCEAAILFGFNTHEHGSNLPELVQLFLDGKYEDILELSEILRTKSDSENNSKSIGNFIKHNVEIFISQEQENLELRHLSVLILGASCLQLFVQNNWLGPPTSKQPLEFFHEYFHDKTVDIEKESLQEMSVDGETSYPGAKFLIYLYLAKVILLECRSFFSLNQTWDWWLARCLLIQQGLLSERCPTLKATVMELLDDLSKREPLMIDDLNRDIQILFHIEAGHACHTYYEYKKAAHHFATGKKIAEIDVSLTGAMGKRTHFQEEDKAQLVLHVEKRSVNDKETHNFKGSSILPKNLLLDDDTVLNSIKFADDTVTETANISPLEQALIIGLMESYRRSMAQDRLTEEEVLTYISYILSNVSSWNVSLVALNLRSRLERDSRRRVERSMMQLEELVKIAGAPNSSPDISCRIPLFYACTVPPVWKVQGELAALLLSLGCIGDALNVYEKLEMWENVISCYQRLGKRERAETVIRERLAIQETPSLLCFLGDVTRDLQHYQRAWEISNHKSARAMRCMGYVYFQEQKFEKAVECFATSLKINSLQIPVWFTYGCAAMACQKFEDGAKAFKRCVNIDFDNFEAWSNLATCYARLKQIKKAYATLQDALKCNYESWKLWENSLIIGTDCGAFEDVIRSYHRLLDLRDKWIDNEVLSILTRAVLEKIPDVDGRPADRLRGKLMELFGRITSKVTSEGDIWANYAKLSSAKIGDKDPELEKALQYLQKSHRCLTQKLDWEKDIGVCQKVAYQAIDLAQLHMQCSEGKSQPEVLQLLSAAKLMLNGALVKIQKQHTDPITKVLLTEAVEMCQKMEQRRDEIICKIDVIRNG